jgi:hypothetical protein
MTHRIRLNMTDAIERYLKNVLLYNLTIQETRKAHCLTFDLNYIQSTQFHFKYSKLMPIQFGEKVNAVI